MALCAPNLISHNPLQRRSVPGAWIVRQHASLARPPADVRIGPRQICPVEGHQPLPHPSEDFDAIATSWLQATAYLAPHNVDGIQPHRRPMQVKEKLFATKLGW